MQKMQDAIRRRQGQGQAACDTLPSILCISHFRKLLPCSLFEAKRATASKEERRQHASLDANVLRAILYLASLRITKVDDAARVDTILLRARACRSQRRPLLPRARTTQAQDACSPVSGFLGHVRHPVRGGWGWDLRHLMCGM
jgi:hypothetical protein